MQSQSFTACQQLNMTHAIIVIFDYYSLIIVIVEGHSTFVVEKER